MSEIEAISSTSEGSEEFPQERSYLPSLAIALSAIVASVYVKEAKRSLPRLTIPSLGSVTPIPFPIITEPSSSSLKSPNANQKKDISYILSSLGTLPYWRLLMQKTQLDAAGDRIDDLHPFAFLLSIYQDPTLRGYMPTILNAWMLKDPFVKGVAKNMQREQQKNQIGGYLEEFAGQVDLDLEQLRDLLREGWRGNWEPLLKGIFLREPS